MAFCALLFLIRMVVSSMISFPAQPKNFYCDFMCIACGCLHLRSNAVIMLEKERDDHGEHYSSLCPY